MKVGVVNVIYQGIETGEAAKRWVVLMRGWLGLLRPSVTDTGYFPLLTAHYFSDKGQSRSEGL